MSASTDHITDWEQAYLTFSIEMDYILTELEAPF